MWPDSRSGYRSTHRNRREENTECIVVNLSGSVAKTLHSLNALKRVPEEHFVDTLDEARLLAKSLLHD